MKIFRYLSCLLILLAGSSSARQVSVIKVTDLQKRLSNNSDTTYIVNFWATWCPPCVAELPEIDAFGQSHRGSNIKVLLVSINYKEDLNTKLLPFLEEKKISSEVCLLDENNFDYFPGMIDKRWNGDLPATLILNNKRGYKEIWQEKISTAFLEEKTKNLLTMDETKRPSVIKVDDLLRRIINNSDTTYVVNFWATWCVPCVQELPGFEKMNERYASQKVKVLLVSMDFVEDYDKKLLPFLKQKDIRSEVMLMDESNANYFIPKVDDRWTGSLPCTIILNNAKKIKECYEKKISEEFLKERIEASLK